MLKHQIKHQIIIQNCVTNNVFFFPAFPLLDAAGRLREFFLIPKNNILTPVDICKTSYTDFVTVYDHKDNERLFEIIKKINDTGASSALIGAHTNNTNYTSKWSNSDDVTFTSFSNNCSKGICGAAMRTNGSWERLPYNDTKYFMCYDEGNHLCFVLVRCVSKYYIETKRIVYYFILTGVDRASHNLTLIRQNKTWTNAQLYCRENHTDLVSIRDEQENERVKNKTKDIELPFWIGLLYDNIEWFDGGKSAYRYKLNLNDKHFTLLIQQTNDWQQRSLGNFNALCYSKSKQHFTPGFKNYAALKHLSHSRFVCFLCQKVSFM